jgi:AcrR family transcriptional regulator
VATVTTTRDPHAVRPPKQARTREAWERALDVGLALLQEGGLDAVTVSEVCRRSGISAPSLYARVDGLAGLVAAVYEHGMTAVRATEAELMAGIPGPDSPPEARIAAVVDVLAELFLQHRAILRPVIASSVRDDRIHTRGVEESLRARAALSSALGLGPRVGNDIAAMVFAEVVVRTVYGDDFSTPSPESEREFRARLTRMGLARAALDL